VRKTLKGKRLRPRPPLTKGKLLALLRPGMRIKRWILGLFVGVLLSGLGVAYILVELYRSLTFPPFVYYLTLQFIPRFQRGLLVGCLGITLTLLSFVKLSQRLLAPLLAPTARSGRERGVLDLFYRYYTPRHRPQVVVFAGTHGLSILLGIADQVPWEIVGVLPPVNSGPAFARLRTILGITADEVLFPTLDRVEVVAEFADGTVLEGEAAIAARKTGAPIRRVFLKPDQGRPETIQPTAEVIRAIEQADVIVIGPGSLFTNLIPTLLIPPINQAIRESQARKVFVCNIMTQPGQTEGFTVADHVRAIQEHCGFKLDYVLVSPTEGVDPAILARYQGQSAQPVPVRDPTGRSQIVLFEGTPEEVVLIEGAILVEREMTVEVEEEMPEGDRRVVLRHDPARLSEAILDLLYNYALQTRLSVSRAAFRAYDVRGVAGAEVNASVMEVMGQAFGTFVQRQTGRNRIVTGRDVRLTSADFQQAVIRGLLQAGCEVIDVGQVPTPVLSFAANHLFTAGGVMVTASHNPAEFNGLKFQVGAQALAGQELQYLERLIARNALIGGREGTLTQREVEEDYIACVESKVQLRRPLRIVIDGGNGVAGPLAVRLMERLGCSVVSLYCQPDGHFPHHPPDPAVADNLRDLSRRVREVGADLGLAFDGDGDRLGVVDERGEIVLPDQYLALLARDLLRKGPAKIVFEVKCSQALVDEIVRCGGIPVMSKCGGAFVAERMRQEKAVLGGELSGHLLFDDPPVGYSDAIFGAARLLAYIASEDAPLSALVASLPRYVSTPEIRIPCADARKFQIVEAVRDHFLDHWPILDIDGVRVDFGDGWALVRASNTEPKLSLRFEARTPRRLREIRQIVAEAMASCCGVEVPTEEQRS